MFDATTDYTDKTKHTDFNACPEPFFQEETKTCCIWDVILKLWKAFLRHYEDFYDVIITICLRHYQHKVCEILIIFATFWTFLKTL